MTIRGGFLFALRAFALLAALGRADPGNADGAPAPRHLLVQVRDAMPAGGASLHHASDGSYTASTGGGAERDDRSGASAPDNATTASTGEDVRIVRVLEGERVRVDLPSVQSLQFHVPLFGRGAAGSRSAPGAIAAAGGSASGAPGAVPGSIARSAASGVVYFEAVSAFSARFALAGSRVQIELVPLQAGDVAAPYLGGAAGERPAPVLVLGRVGEWIPLGDADRPVGGKSLTPNADAPTMPTIWVRVRAEAPDQP